MRNPLISIALDAAVPLWIMEVRTWTPERRAERAHVCGQHVAEHGDVIQFREKHKTSEAFNRLAEGLALLSFAPGGVTFEGAHWETT